MLRFAIWLTVFLAVSGQQPPENGEPDADILVSQLTVSELRELIRETMAEALPLHNNCTDYSDEGECPQVVENNLCNKEEFYARYCCRSCTLAKQIPTYGTHLSLTAEAPITANITTEQKNYPRGSNVNLSCEATGFPTPEMVWFKNYIEISSSKVYDTYAEVIGGILVKTIRSDLLIKNYSMDGDYSHYECMAINSAGKSRNSIVLNIEDEVSMTFRPEVPMFTDEEDVQLDCIVKGTGLSKVSWYREDILVQESRRYRIEERRQTSSGLTVVHSKLKIVRDKVRDSGKLFTCSVNDRSGRVKEIWKDLIISEAKVDHRCRDLAGIKACYEDSRMCRFSLPYVSRYCCRTCTLLGTLPTIGDHLGSRAEAPLEVTVKSDWGDRNYGEDMTLSCVTTGYPDKQTIIWTKDEDMVFESDHHHLKETVLCSALSCVVRSYLTIKGLRVEDAGWYKCVARNPVSVNHQLGLLSFTESGKGSFSPHILT